MSEDPALCDCKKDPPPPIHLLPEPRLSLHVASEEMKGVFRKIEKAAPSNVTVIILGKSGTGKELVAREIHSRSGRAQGPFVAVNTAALALAVLESELFGHEKGAFTGALDRRIGLIETANGGTFFLDEIGDMPLEIQVKLLRVIENREILRVGSSVPVRVDVRIIAATNKDLDSLMREGKFREDLYYRLSGVRIELPPLCSRGEDLEILVNEFLTGSVDAARKRVRSISPELLKILRTYDWPGNVRELRNLVDAMVVEDDDGILNVDDLPDHVKQAIEKNPVRLLPLPPAEADSRKVNVLSILARLKWHMTRAAAEIGISRRTLARLLKEWGISRK